MDNRKQTSVLIGTVIAIILLFFAILTAFEPSFRAQVELARYYYTTWKLDKPLEAEITYFEYLQESIPELRTSIAEARLRQRELDAEYVNDCMQNPTTRTRDCSALAEKVRFIRAIEIDRCHALNLNTRKHNQRIRENLEALGDNEEATRLYWALSQPGCDANLVEKSQAPLPWERSLNNH